MREDDFFPEEILEQLRMMEEKDLIFPNGKLIEGETVVLGDISMKAKKVYSLWMRYDRRTLEISTELRYEVNEKAEALLRRMCQEAMAWRDFLERLFWVIVREENSFWDIQTLGIRRNWKLISSDPYLVERGV